jgi:hypothetical protein
MAITRTQQARQMLKKGSKKPVVQGGVDNYLGDQPQVVVPRKWQSGPDKPPTELAYITEAEKKLLLKEDIHGSLKEGPNEGPGGVMSLDSFGDIGGGQAGSDVSRDTDRGRDTGRDDKTTFSNVKAGSGSYESRIFSPADEKLAEQRLKTIQRNEERKAKQFTEQAKKQRSFLNQLKKTGLPTQKLLYSVFPNNPKTELRYLADLKFRNPTAFDQLPQELKDILAETEDPANEFSSYKDFDKFSFDDFKSLTNFQPTDGMTFADYAATYAGAPGLKYSGDVGNLEKFVKGVDEFGRTMYGYREKRDNGSDQRTESELERRLRLLEEQNKQQQAATTSTLPMFRFMNRGGMVEDAPMGGIMDLETTRQMLFIGGVAKGIKKGLKSVTRGIKKVAKSPLGKAALLGAVGFGIPGTQFGGLFGRASFGGAAKGFFGSKGIGPLISSKFSNMTLPKLITDNMGGLQVAALSGLGGALLASLEDKDDDDFNIEEYYKMAGIDIPENQYRFLAEGGSTEKEPVAKKTMPLLDMDGQEMDFRQEGGFVPIGRMEKADDVPARLSKNEFVFTADAVRNAGGGDVDKGAEVMYNTMKNLEAGGEVSEETQGLEGARNMFQTSQRLGEVV